MKNALAKKNKVVVSNKWLGTVIGEVVDTMQDSCMMKVIVNGEVYKVYKEDTRVYEGVKICRTHQKADYSWDYLEEREIKAAAATSGILIRCNIQDKEVAQYYVMNMVDNIVLSDCEIDGDRVALYFDYYEVADHDPSKYKALKSLLK